MPKESLPRKVVDAHYQLQSGQEITEDSKGGKQRVSRQHAANRDTTEPSGFILKTVTGHIKCIPFFAIDALYNHYKKRQKLDCVLQLRKASLRKFDRVSSQRKAAAYEEIGDICGRQGRWKDGAEALQNALGDIQVLHGDDSPQAVRVACYLAGYLSLAGEYDRAEWWYKEIRKHELGREGGGDELALAISFMSLLRVYHYKGRLADAKSLFQIPLSGTFEGIEKFYGPRCASHTQWIAGLVSGKVGRHGLAEEHFRAAWKRGLDEEDVQHEEFYLELGWACLRQGKKDDAHEQINKALDAAAKSKNQRRMLSFLSEEAYHHQSAMRWEETTQICRFALDLPFTSEEKEDRLQILECLEWSLLSLGQLSDAEEVSYSKLAFAKDMPGASQIRLHYFTALCFVWQAKFLEAQELLVKLLEDAFSQYPRMIIPPHAEATRIWCDQALYELQRFIERGGTMIMHPREPPKSSRTAT